MNQTVLITGASRGIGAATAMACARDGFNVAINYASDKIAADRVANAVRESGRRAIALRGDVSKARDVDDLFESIERELGQLSALVNNAGITGLLGTFVDTKRDTLRRVFDVNVQGSFLCAQAALKRFMADGTPGVIVNVSSVAAATGSPGEYVHYAASKAAIETFTRGLAREVAHLGIRVCAVAPGSTLTDIHATAGESGRPARVAKNIPLGRLADPEEIAAAIVWLLSPAASYVTGAILRCTGGL